MFCKLFYGKFKCISWYIVDHLWEILSNESIGDIHVHNYDFENATRLPSWVLIDSSYTLYHIMVPPLICPTYCAITQRHAIGRFGQSHSGHKILSFELDIYTKLGQVRTYYVGWAPYPIFLISNDGRFSLKNIFPSGSTKDQPIELNGPLRRMYVTNRQYPRCFERPKMLKIVRWYLTDREQSDYHDLPRTLYTPCPTLIIG